MTGQLALDARKELSPTQYRHSHRLTQAQVERRPRKCGSGAPKPNPWEGRYSAAAHVVASSRSSISRSHASNVEAKSIPDASWRRIRSHNARSTSSLSAIRSSAFDRGILMQRSCQAAREVWLKFLTLRTSKWTRSSDPAIRTTSAEPSTCSTMPRRPRESASMRTLSPTCALMSWA